MQLVSALVRRGAPAEVRVLVLIVSALTVTCLIGGFFPRDPAYTSETYNFVLGAIGIVLVGTLWTMASATPPWFLQATLATATVLSGVLVSRGVNEGGIMLAGFGYVWLSVYSAVFFPPRAVRLHAALMAASFGAGILVADVPRTLIMWPIVAATVWIASVTLSGLSQHLREQATRDPLTGLLNRDGFTLSAEREHAAAKRTHEPLALIVIDLDGFKLVNDRDGHQAGDRLLRELAAAWQAQLRPRDLLARHGGDEFVLLLPATSIETAEGVLTRLREAHPMRWTSGAILWGAEDPLEAALAHADIRLYDAKRRHPGDDENVIAIRASRG